MTSVATTKLSSKGQIVIPEDVRDRLGLRVGDQFVVFGEKGVVILKMISPPSKDEFDSMITKARKQAKQAGLKKSDVTKSIKAARSKK